MWSLSRRARLVSLLCATGLAFSATFTYAVASKASPAAECFGATQAIFPQQGFITDPARDQGGHMWSRPLPDGSTCIGTVVEFVQYGVAATKTWRVVVYSAAHPTGEVAASETFSLNAGFYFFPFRIRQPFAGVTRVCITATEAFGTSCVRLLPPGAL